VIFLLKFWAKEVDAAIRRKHIKRVRYVSLF